MDQTPLGDKQVRLQEDLKEMREQHVNKEKYYRGADDNPANLPIDINLLRKYILPHLEQLCRQFLQSVIVNDAHEIKLSTIEIKDR